MEGGLGDESNGGLGFGCATRQMDGDALAGRSTPCRRQSRSSVSRAAASLHHIAQEFQMQKHIEAHLRERHSTETQLYQVGELRRNCALAQRLQFQDDPKLKNEDQIPLSKPIGWLQHRELLDVLWSHNHILQHGATGVPAGLILPPNLSEELARIEKELRAVL